MNFLLCKVCQANALLCVVPKSFVSYHIACSLVDLGFTVLVGQCGNQIGGAFWPLALQEHGISTSKSIVQPYRPRCNDAFHSFFWSPTDISGASFRSISDLESAKVKARVCHQEVLLVFMIMHISAISFALSVLFCSGSSH